MNVLGILIIAGFLGACFSSWTLFFVTAIVLFVIAVSDGDIRLNKRRRR